MEILSKMKMNLAGLKIPAAVPDTEHFLTDVALREQSELRKAIGYVLTELRCAAQNFETADTPEMVEHYTYKIKACEVKYQFLLKQLKSAMKEDC